MTKPKNYKDTFLRFKSKTAKQRLLAEAILSNCIIFATGPAGTGKTHVPVALACEDLLDGKIKQIVIARPAITACGEKHGFLPGDIDEKMDPFLRPIYDVMSLYFQPNPNGKGFNTTNYNIEISPLAFMRGRTFDDAVIIIDEGQNTTEEQILMILTRIGKNSKIIIAGDLDQNDIKGGQSGLAKGIKLAGKVDGIVHVEFDINDCVRNPIITDIIKAWSAL